LVITLLNALTCVGAGDAAPTDAAAHWHLPADRTLRLATAWASFRVVGGKVADGWEYGGGGSTSQPLAEPIDLSCSATFDNPRQVAFMISTGSGSITAHVEVPANASIRERPRPALDHLTAGYRVLWMADVCQGDRSVKTLAYAVCGVPLADPSTGLDNTGVAGLESALVAAAR
jgi:hypothetical protein